MSTLIVTNTNDSGNGSLRNAIGQSGAGDTIAFDQALAGQTIYLLTGEFDITHTLTIDGGALGIVLSGDAAQNDSHMGDSTVTDITTSDLSDNTRIFFATAPLTLLGLTLTGGVAHGGENGGAILTTGSELTVELSTIIGNIADDRESAGGGIAINSSIAHITDSTISYGHAGLGGDIGVFNGSDVTLTNVLLSHGKAYAGSGIHTTSSNVAVVNSTIADNFEYYGRMSVGGGAFLRDGSLSFTNVTLSGNDAGIVQIGGSLSLANSIVAGNYQDIQVFNGASGPALTGGNIIGGTFSVNGVAQQTGIALSDVFAVVDHFTIPGLSGQLADNGGPVETIALKKSTANPAIDASNTSAPATDAAGNARFDHPGVANANGSAADLGALETLPEDASLVVTTLTDVVDPFDGLTSLREAVAFAVAHAGADTITFATGLAGGTITLTAGEIVVSGQITIDGDIDGNGRADIAISGNHASRVFRLPNTSNLTLTGLTIQDGHADDGGAIQITGASLTLINATLSGNSADSSGGAIYSSSFGSTTMTNVTLTGNSAGGSGGVIFDSFANLALTNVTFAGNSANGAGGGIYANRGSTWLTNVTMTGNSAADGGAIFMAHISATLTNSIVTGNPSGLTTDLWGDSHSGYDYIGRNIAGTDVLSGDTDIGDTTAADVFAQTVDVDPGAGIVLAGVLADNGGPVQTVALKAAAGNPALDASDASASAADARGQSRQDLPAIANLNGSAADLGAYEVVVSAPTDIALTNAAVAENTANGTVVGALSATDPDAGDTATFTLADEAGGRFGISGSNLVVANGALLDYESATSHSVTVRVTDAFGLSLDKVFGIAVTDIDEPAAPTQLPSQSAPHPFQWAGSGNLGSHGSGYQAAGVGDFNGDGTADVLWRNPTTGAVDEWKMQNGNWAGSVDLGSRGPGYQVAGIGDFNGDGVSDVLWRDTATGKLDAWIMANGQWSKSVDLGARGADWKVLGVGDFNGDGTSDILFQNTKTGAVDEWVMSGGNWSASTSLGSRDLSYSSVAIGDLDGDGTSDVLWHNPTTGAVDQWHMRDGNWAGSIGLGNFNTGYDLAAVNDFNGDGTADVLWRNPTSGKVDGWVMEHGNWFASVSLGSLDPAFRLAGTGDFNHSAGADVLWHNETTGQTATWLLDAI